MPRQPSGCSRFSAGSSTMRSPTSHSTIHSGVPAEDGSLGPVRSSALDDRSEHHSQRSTQTSRHAGVHGFAGMMGKTSSSSCPVVGRHIMVPHHGAGPTGSKFLSGFCQRWPGGHLQQSCKVYPSPPRRRK